MKQHWKQILRRFTFGLLLIPAVAWSQGAASGIDARVLAKAKAGDAASQYLVGIEYQKGDVVARDFVQAADWYRKAAEQGYAEAQCKLGELLQQPNAGVVEDDAKAAEWLHKAADQGFVEAEYRLGLCYSRGAGVPKDDAQAAAWFTKAVAQRDPGAMERLALLTANGQGVAKDEKQAFGLMSQAGELGSAEAEYWLGVDYEQGHGVKKDKNQAAAWYRKSADQGFAEAQLNLAQFLGSKYAEAYFWFSLATRSLDGDALTKASILRDDAAEKLKPAEKADADRRLSQWHPVHPAQP
jgi:TPR repeat protein